jgi:hypothetical protein
MLICLPFILMGLWLAYNQHNLIGWLCTGFFGLGIPVGLVNLFDRRPQIIINETGIFDRSAYKDFVNWDIIEHAYWNTTYNERFVCLIVKPEFKHLIKGKTRLRAVSKAMGYEEINISLGAIRNIDHEKLTGLIVNLANANPAQRSNLIKETKNGSTDQLTDKINER